jgi:hypothetical protein
VDAELNRWDVEQEYCDACLKDVSVISVLVGDTLGSKVQVDGSCDDIVNNLSYYCRSEEGALTVEQSFGCVANLLLGVWRNSVESWD